MTDSSLQAVLRIIPTLSAPELEEVRVKASAALSVTGPQPVNPRTGAENWLQHGVVTLLRTRGLIRSDFIVLDGKARAALAEAETALLEAVRKPLSYGEKLVLGRVVAEAMADMISRYATLGPKIMIQHVPKALQAVEDAFPGYLGAGMVGLLVGKYNADRTGS